MLKYFLYRVLQLIPVFFGATFLIYAMVFLMPGDPVAALGGDRGLDPQTILKIRAEYNLDKSFLTQYFIYIKNIFTLDFGKTFSGIKVTEVIINAFPFTIKLAFMSVIFETIFGVLFGFYSGIKKGGIFDSTILIISLIIIAIPTFVIGFLIQFILGIKFKLLPTTVGTNTSLIAFLMPSLVLGSTSFAYIVRLVRQEVSNNISADYVKTAKAKGLSKFRILIFHVLRNSLIPVITFIGADLGALMGGAIVTEGIFGINGVGGLLYHSILRGESATVVSITTILVILYILINLLIDLSYAFLDPRIRYYE